MSCSDDDDDESKTVPTNHVETKSSQVDSTTIRRFLTPSKKLQIAASQQWRCPLCRQLLPASFVMDHIKPLRYGGTNALTNFQALCANCHANKSTRESQLYAEKLQEKKTKISRFFNPMCLSCLVNPNFDNRYYQNAHRKKDLGSS